MIFEVTIEDIKKGKKTDCYSCPIALAIRRKLPKSYIKVFSGSGFFIDRVRYEQSHEVVVFTQKFDRNEPVEPFEFELEIK